MKIDGGAWQDAELGPTPATSTGASGSTSGTRPRASTTSPPASIDGDGDVQTDVRAEPFPEGASGIHTLIVTSRDSLTPSSHLAQSANPAPGSEHLMSAPTNGRLHPMKLTTLRRGTAAAAVLALSFTLAACGGDDEPTSRPTTPVARHRDESPRRDAAEEEATDAGAADLR